MSGPLCPHCGCPILHPDESALGAEQAICEFCGWKGDTRGLPRRFLHKETYEQWHDKIQRLRQGSLAIVTITGNEQLNHDIVSDVMHAFGLKSSSHQTIDGKLVMRIELSTKPSTNTLDLVRKIPGILDVLVR